MDFMQREDKYEAGFYSKRGIDLKKGKGALVWDSEGKEYIDCFGNVGVLATGHCHPHVVKAIKKQAETLTSCIGFFYNEVRADLVTKMYSIMPRGISRFFLANSGTEATEGALKIARISTGRPKFVSTINSFHGRTLGAVSVTGREKYRKPVEPLLSDVEFVPFNDITAAKIAIDDNTAAFIIEPVQGEGGVRIVDSDYLREISRICFDTGTLLILDEVQTGFARTGKMFAFEHSGVVPDLLCLGKSIAGGFPMGAIGIGDRIEPVPKGVHGSTNGGNPLSCAAALASIEVIEKENLVARSEELGNYIKDALKNIKSDHLKEIRGLGMMTGIELNIPAAPFIKSMQDQGVLVTMAGTNVVRLLPPVVIKKQQLEKALDIVVNILST